MIISVFIYGNYIDREFEQITFRKCKKLIFVISLCVLFHHPTELARIAVHIEQANRSKIVQYNN